MYICILLISNSNHKNVSQLSACGKAPEASSAECLIESKSTYALRSADPGSSRRLTNLCFRIACLIQRDTRYSTWDTEQDKN